MRSKKTQYMTFMAMFLAIEIILVVTPLGYIPIGPLSATTMHIPVIIAGITLGKKAGAQLGLVFGLTSLIRATIQPGITSFCFSPFVTVGNISGDWRSVIIALVPRILLGYLAGVIFEFIKNKFNNVITRGFYHHTGLTVQAFEQPCQLAQFTVGVKHLKGRDYHLSKRAHDCNHALTLGNIDANAVHSHSSTTKNLQPESIFSRCRFNLLRDANSPASR